MPPPNMMLGIRAKVARAEEHLNRLQHEFISYVAEHPSLITGYFEAERQGGKMGLHSQVVLKALPPDLGVTIGDFVHCLRSALDHLAWKLAEVPTENTSFPIQDRATDVDKDGNPVHPSITGGLSEEAGAIVAQLQPWWPTGELSHVGHPLRLLRELSNNDKHRILTIPLMGYDMALAGAPPQLSEGMRFRARLTSVDQWAGRAEFRLVGVDTQSEVEMDAQFVWDFSVRVRVLKSGEEIDFLVIPTLYLMLELVRDQIIPLLQDEILR